ncbi:vesicle-associated protein 2-2-like isoform X2 [Gastrolobium bilobum]|uniref:vesicle-associated protein 2-2-like isoform X2 n=1 Tax=Gastrolobium bilobum TaxID=150636 RepID=UPI002AB04276|nr:vesicle-associated protein 2-2-like isoform X2 [Gastrolobium bilobum]
MNKEPILEIEPKELRFTFELMKQSSCSVQLSNNTYHRVAFKVKTTSPRKYSVRPNVGILAPKSTCEFIVTMQAPRVAPEDMVCKDKFLIQSTLVTVETNSEDVTSSLFAKDGSRYIEENKLKVVLISQPDSPELSSINGDLKNGLDHEEFRIYSKDEIQSPDPMVPRNSGFNMFHEVLKLEEDMELKPEHVMGLNAMKHVEEQKEEPGLKVSKDEVLNTVKDVEELEPRKKLELKVSKDLDLNTEENSEEPKPEKEAELKMLKDLDLNTVNNVEELKTEKVALKVPKDLELRTVKNVEELKQEKEAELRVSRGTDELKLMEAIEEMKLKLDGLESKLNESGVTISKLTEERRLSNQEAKILQDKLKLKT